MPLVRDALNELKWRHHALDDALIWYVHRGAPGDRQVVSGADVVEVGRSFFERRDGDHTTSIPFHRVVRIEWHGASYWDRRTTERHFDARGPS